MEGDPAALVLGKLVCATGRGAEVHIEPLERPTQVVRKVPDTAGAFLQIEGASGLVPSVWNQLKRPAWAVAEAYVSDEAPVVVEVCKPAKMCAAGTHGALT